MTSSIAMSRERFEDLVDDVVTLVENTTHPADRPADAPTQVQAHLTEWYEDDDLSFGRSAVWHSLEDAGVSREDRFAIVDSVAESFEELNHSGGES